MSKALTKRNRDVTPSNSPTPPKAADWAICDISLSMGGFVHGTDKTRIDCLNAALLELGDDVQVIAFSDTISREKIGHYTPSGGTYIVPALREVARHEPSYIVVISDGEISETHSEALGVADKIATTAVIDTIYIGPDDARAEDFMRKLAEAGHGRFRKYDPSTIVEKMQTLLPPPANTIEI